VNHSGGLRVLFPTTFSDACVRAGKAIAQLADTCPIDLTLVHVTSGAGTWPAQRRLESFMAGATGYARCRRVLIKAGNRWAPVADLCQDNRFDLVIVPSSERKGMRDILMPSFRSRLLQRCGVPLWTAGRGLMQGHFKRPIRTVACLLDFADDAGGYLPMVAAFAARFNARLRVLHVIPPVDEGTLAQVLSSDAPLLPAAARSRVHDAFVGQRCPEVDVVTGHCELELRRMVQRADADLLFVGPAHTAKARWFLRHLDRLPCPVVCVDATAASFTRWTFGEPLLQATHQPGAVVDAEMLAS
jgi:nucleotide-binding universal stress UspA family protein